MRVLMLTQDVEVDRRIVQEARSLTAAGHEVGILARAAGIEDRLGVLEGIPVEWLAVKGRDRRFNWLYRLAGPRRGSQAAALWGVLTGRHTFGLRALPRALAARADVYHAHDLNTLEVAHRAASARGARLVYDAHELFPELANRWVRLKRRSWSRLEQRLLPRADLAITVNELIADEMARRYDVPPPLVILNCPDPPPEFDCAARYDLIRSRTGVGPQRKVVLYHGWMSEERGLDDLVRCARHLANEAAVVLMGYGEFRTTLEKRAAREPPGRVYFLPAVPQRELLAYCASADVGVIPYQPVSLNDYYASPNKLFDFIQSAVPIVANDLPYLRRMVAGHRLGVVARLDSPESYASAINSLLTLPDGGAELRASLRRVAPRYAWEPEARKLVAAYAALPPPG
jgi:glycosyltransferase involved in cell wall biosynthesis